MQCLDRNSGFGQKQQIFYQYLRTSSEEEGLVNLHQVFVNSSGNKQNADYTRALPGQQKYYSLAPLLLQRFANRSFFSLSLEKPARFSSVELFPFIYFFLQIRVHQDLLGNFLQHQISIRHLLFCNKSKLRILSTFTSATTVLQHNSQVPS